MSERFTAPQDDALYLQMCAEIEEKLRRAAPLYTRRYPHVSTLPAEGLALHAGGKQHLDFLFPPRYDVPGRQTHRRCCVPEV